MGQYLKITQSTTLTDLADMIGVNNIEYTLALNNLSWSPNVGEQFYQMQSDIMSNADEVTWQRKSTLLNTLTTDTDVFETAALMNESGWKVLDNLDTIPNTLKLPSTTTFPNSEEILGDGNSVGTTIYNLAIEYLTTPPHTIDPIIFNEYSTIKATQIVDSSSVSSYDTFSAFAIPWGEVTLYSSIDDESVDFPVYPEEISDSTTANYDEMSEILYQYEPWYTYKSSGPRTVPYTFNFHRQMWTGDETDGKANDLIRFCQANCYPNYNGSAVITPLVTLYIAGSAHIHGIMTDVSVKWDGPLLSDNWYAHCELEITITEVSETSLTYDTVRSKSLIG